MKKYIEILYFIPAIIFATVYLIMVFAGFGIVTVKEVLWLTMLLVGGIILSNGKFWGGVFGLIPAAVFIYMSIRYTGQVINIERPLGIIIAVYYILCSVIVYIKTSSHETK